MLYRRIRLVRLFASVLLGSMGTGLISPVLAAGDIAAQLTAEGIDQETLNVAMTAVSDSDSPTDVAQAVADAFGDEASAQDAFLRALYGRLYQILQFQQGPVAVTVSLVGASLTLDLIPDSAVFNASPVDPGTNCLVFGSSPNEERVFLPRVQDPAVQPLGQ